VFELSSSENFFFLLNQQRFFPVLFFLPIIFFLSIIFKNLNFHFRLFYRLILIIFNFSIQQNFINHTNEKIIFNYHKKIIFHRYIKKKKIEKLFFNQFHL